MSIDNPLVLVVDPDPIHQEILDGMLGESMTVILANTAKEGLELFDFKHPDLVILEIDIPDKSGYELCKELREHADETACAIIFLAQAMSLEDKMEGYRYGCDDFITKPFQPEEVVVKAQRTLEIKKVQKKMLRDSSEAMHTALIAMKQSSDMGFILRFMEENANCRDFPSLGQSLIDLLKQLSLQATLVFKVKPKNIFVGNPYDSLDVKQFNMCFEEERFVAKGENLVVNQDIVSLLISNMPKVNSKAYSELKDILSMLMSSVEARAVSIDLDLKHKERQNKQLEDTLDKCHQHLADVNATLSSHGDSMGIISGDLIHDIKDICISLAITGNQETSIVDAFEDSLSRITQSYTSILSLEENFNGIINDLKELVHKTR
jgi:CheY-like chemotaxis protein